MLAGRALMLTLTGALRALADEHAVAVLVRSWPLLPLRLQPDAAPFAS